MLRIMRTRFAPSPTGALHVGGVRTALYAYILAKQTKGQFLLRIEDTDQARSVPGTVENIINTLSWCGLTNDEGVTLRDGSITEIGKLGPYTQSKRLDLYKRYADQLVASGHAYPCFCTPERLDEMRKIQQAAKQAPMYDRHCLKLSKEEVAQKLVAGEKHVLRLKMPHEEKITFTDEIRGPLEFMGHLIDDQVLMKSDGFPTYHLAHVVDDHLMEIDMVIRGEEWLSSLPKHLVLFQALGWKTPRYAHLPLLLNPDRTKLSKRQGDVAAEEYRQKGYLPEAMINFLALLGWNPGTEQEIFSLDELIKAFSLERVQKAGAIFDLQKLEWLQGQWIRKLSPKEFEGYIHPVVSEKFPAAKKDPDFGRKASLIQERMTLLPEAAEMLSFFYAFTPPTADVLLNAKQGVTKDNVNMLKEVLVSSLSSLDAKKWNQESVEKVLMDALEKNDLKKGQLLWTLRALLTGKAFSPGAFEVATALGREETLKRLIS
jgi:glutamyl-tRNA synthetase